MKAIQSAILIVLAGAIISGSLTATSPWVPYSAQYMETTTSVTRGGTKASSTKYGKEYRSVDGSQAKFTLIDGQPVGGEIWLSCGQVLSLDYSAKHASQSQRSAFAHLQPSPDPPIGTQTIAGVTATGYPIHIHNGAKSVGSASVWIDNNSEIVLKIEAHTNLNGSKYDYVKQITSLDLSPSGLDVVMKVPAGFTVTDSPVTGSCGSNTR